MGIGTSGASASVLPATHKLKLAVGFSDTSAAEMETTGLTDDLVSVQPMGANSAAEASEKPTVSFSL